MKPLNKRLLWASMPVVLALAACTGQPEAAKKDHYEVKVGKEVVKTDYVVPGLPMCWGMKTPI